MCGILLSIRAVDNDQLSQPDELFGALLSAVKPRGPNSVGIHTTCLPLGSTHTLEVKLAASVLGLRGNGITRQPLEDERGVLAYNGQIFQGLDVDVEDNDTIKLFQRLKTGTTLSDICSSVEGPYVTLSTCEEYRSSSGMRWYNLMCEAFNILYAIHAER
jgi:asparagine synthetase B (glutamine-hydrolysing)